MSQVLSKYLSEEYGKEKKIAPMPASERQDFTATHLSRECLEEMAQERNK